MRHTRLSLHFPDFDISWQSLRICIIAMGLTLALAGCTVRLAPEHEPAIVQGLQNLSVATETFLDTNADGTRQAEFESKREQAYSELVGKAKGVLNLVELRPKPEPALARWFGFSSADKLDDTEDSEATIWSDIKRLDVPTDNQLQWYLEELERLRTSDRKADLPSEAIEAFSQPLRRALKNAIAYEMALDR